MQKLINKDFGNEMWVSEDRLQEYLAKGHTLADTPSVKETPKDEEKPKRTIRKRK